MIIRAAAVVFCVAIMGCSQARYVPNTSISSASSAGTRTYRVLHSFGYGLDGSGPRTSLIDVNGTL
jgi:hypothetical protein